MRILTIATGILLILTSIWCFANSGTVFFGMAFILGIVMIFTGAASACTYFAIKNNHHSTGWLLAEAITTFALGCIVLSNQLATDAVIPLFFGMWIMYSGTIRAVASLSMKRAGDNTWVWTMVMGVICAASGIYSFFNPIAAGLAIIVLIGVFFLIQGVSVLAYGITMPSKKKR